MKKYWPLLLIVGILTAIICMSQYADSAKHRYEESAAQTKAAAVAKGDDGKAGNYAEETYKPPIWAKFVTWPEGVGAWAVILTLLAIAWQSVETRAAAIATEASVEAGKDTAERQLRAYVVVERGIIANVANPLPHPGEKVETVARLMQPDAGPTVQITIKNTGQTPAYELVHWGRLCIDAFPLASSLPTMPDNAGKFCTVMGPGIVEVKTVRLSPLTTEDIQALHEGTKVIYCHGEIHYRDAFKNWRVTMYRCMYASEISGRIGVGTDMTYCEEGNEAT